MHVPGAENTGNQPHPLLCFKGIEMQKLNKFVLLLIFVSACDKTPADSNDEPVDTALTGMWSTKLAISATETVEGFWEFSENSISIDWYGLQAFSASYTTDSTTTPQQIDMDFDEYTPFHYDPVPGIYKLIGQDSLVISISNSNGGNQQPIRPVNFNVTEENENYVHTFTRVD